MAWPGFPKPYPDELLYSVIARCAVHFGIQGPKSLAMTAFRNRNSLAVPDLPTNLMALASIARELWSMDLHELLHGHTALPYYARLRGREAYRRLSEAMLSPYGGIHARVGISASTVRPTGAFRLCPDCVQGELSLYGEAFWHRTHQLPGVWVCPLHECVLHETSVRFRAVERNVYVHAQGHLLQHGNGAPTLGKVGFTAALEIARRSLLFASEPVEGSGDLEDFRPLLRRHGFASTKSGISATQSALASILDDELRSLLFKGTANPLRWVCEVWRKPRRHPQPLQRILLDVLLESSAFGMWQAPIQQAVPRRHTLYRDPELRARSQELLRQGMGVSRVARALGVDRTTAYRLIRPLPTKQSADVSRRIADDKRDWNNVRDGSPPLSTSELRAKFPALYARLYRSDRVWLLAHPGKGAHERQTDRRVNWPERDLRLAKKIKLGASNIRSRQPWQRASRNRILGELHARHLLAHYANKLPLSVRALEQHSESVSEFQVRRVLLVLRSVPDCGTLSTHAIFRLARVNPYRLPDGGVSLLTLARSLLLNAGSEGSKK